MTTAQKFKHTNAFRRTAAIAILCGLAAGLSGCDQGGTVPQALAEAQAKMLSVTAGGVAAPPGERRKVYQSVVSSLQSEASSLEGVSQQTAFALMGEAQAGLAQLRLLEASEQAQAAASELSRMRVLGAEFASHTARAAAMRTGDSGADLDRLAGEAQRVASEIEQSRIDREGVLAQIAQLNRRAQEQGDQGRAIRAEEAQIRERAIRAGSQERAELTERAHGVSRRAAQHERAASDLLAQAEVLRPELRNAEIRLEQLRALSAQLEKTKSEIEGERRRRLDDAQIAQNAADGAMRALTESLATLRTQLETGFEAASSDAIRAYEQAIGTLRRAAQGNSAATRLALGAAQQGLGDAQRQRATIFEQGVMTLAFLAELPGRPGVAGDAGAFADALRAKAGEASRAAGAAYGDSAASLRSGAGRVTGDAKATVDRAVESLEALAASLKGETPAPAQTEPTEPTETDDEPAGLDDDMGG